MKQTIIIVSYVSFTASDNYLHSEQKTFTNHLKAQDYFEDCCKSAEEECRWGSQYDEPEDERDEDCAYEVDVDNNGSTKDGLASFKVSSDAYEGYWVKIDYKTEEIEVPYATDRTKYGMTLKEVRDEIAAFTGDTKSEAMRKAKIFAHHISVSHVCQLCMRFGICKNSDGSEYENHDWLEIRWTDLDGDQDTFSIID